MNKKDAQFILESYRPGTEDDSDPLFREALAVAEKNPELLDWLKKSEAMDKEIHRALQEIQPPKALRSSILNAHEKASKQENPAPHTTHPSWWQSPWTLSMAASLALMLFIAVSAIKPREAEADWDVARIFDSVSEQAGQSMKPASEHISLDTLKARLANGDLPQEIQQTNKGYALLDWDGLPVEQWTFSSESGETYNLYTIDRNELTPKPTLTHPVYKQMGDTALAAWTTKGTLYVVAHTGKTDALKEMLKGMGSINNPSTPKPEPLTSP